MRLAASAGLLALLAASVAARNCPGSIQNDGNSGNDQYCCIGGHVTVSVCPGWPMCTGPTTVNPMAKPSCATKVPWTASNYDQLVSSASSRYLNAQGSITATGGTDDPTVGSGSSAPTGAVASATSGTACAIPPLSSVIIALDSSFPRPWCQNRVCRLIWRYGLIEC